MSAIAPEGRPKASTGRLAAVCISAMRKGDDVMTAISHVAAVSCIHVPTFDTIDASQRLRNDGCRSGLSAVPEPDGETNGINHRAYRAGAECRCELRLGPLAH